MMNNEGTKKRIPVQISATKVREGEVFFTALTNDGNIYYKQFNTKPTEKGSNVNFSKWVLIDELPQPGDDDG